MPSHPRRFFVRLLAATALGVLALSPPAPASAEIKRLELIAPANPGGGWDQTARVIQTMLQQAGLASGVQVQNIPGAGGTIGLAQFVSAKRRKSDAILVAGQTLQGAIITNKTPVSLDQVTPLARIVGEYEIVVVPVDSPIRTIADLVAKLKENPGAVSWGGGSAGSTDHIVAGLIMKAVGADVSKLNYVPHSGGGEALSSILGGHVTVGLSGYGEFGPQVNAGKLRALAVSSEKRLPGVDIPTLKEQGLDVAFFNWRGLFAPPDIRGADLETLKAAITAMAASQAWKDTVAQRQWTDLYQPANEFAAFLKEDRVVMQGILTDLGLAK
jgi:putative tricarboxylic transport membrane protein